MSDRPAFDPSKQELATPAGVRPSAESDPQNDELAELAARFASRSNGGLSLELSAELALEILLNEIAEQACAATGATGAAIALQRDGEMVCRATSGTTAPDLGSRVDLQSGLSGKCVQTRQTQRCEDVIADPQADIAASERLGVRSVIVMPLLQGSTLIGVFELFSSLPFAFSETDENILQGFAQRALNNIERSKQSLDPQPEPVAEIASKAEEVAPVAVSEPVSSSGIVTWALVAAIVLTAMLLGMALGRHVIAKKLAAKLHSTFSEADRSAAVQAPGPVPAAAAKAEEIATATSTAAQAPQGSALPPGSLAVYDNGKQIFRVTPDEKSISGSERASGVEPASAINKESVVTNKPVDPSVLYRVNPAYPDAARRAGIHGLVVLDVYIAKDGSVQGVQVVSGPPELSETSITAIKQWRFKPVSGNPAEMQKRVTLNYVLPK